MKTQLIALLFIIFGGTIFVVGQSADCPIEVDTALTTANEICIDTGRNQVCYGNNNVNLVSYSDNPIEFDSPGDITEVNNIRTMSLSALDEATGSWGIAIMRLLANLNPTATEDITVLLFGDVEIEDAVGYHDIQSIVSTNYVNMRRYPDSEATVMDSIAKGDTVEVYGKLEDRTWVRVVNPETNVAGWIFASLLDEIDFDSLSIASAYEPYFAPMQAFYFESGTDSLDCSSVPRDGMIVQTPEGLRRVTLWINEVTIDFLPGLGSTALIQTESDQTMSINILEGSAYIGTESEGYVAVVGSTVNVVQNKDNDKKVKVSAPTATNTDNLGNVPLTSLDREIEIPAPAADTLINEANAFTIDEYIIEDEDSTDSDSVEDIDNNCQIADCDSDTICPGNSCHSNGNGNANGHTICPGNSCHSNPNGPNNCPGNSCNSNGNGKNKDKNKDK